MRELTIEQTKQVSGGALPLLLVADFAVGVTAGAALKKLWNKFHNDWSGVSRSRSSYKDSNVRDTNSSFYQC